MGELGPFCSPELRAGLPAEVWERVQAARVLARADVPTVQTGEVLVLVEQRERARAARDWSAADTLRERIADMGWQVLDTPDGPRLEPVRAGSQSC
jgi:cysteinyl-tRNA synthetase